MRHIIVALLLAVPLTLSSNLSSAQQKQDKTTQELSIHTGQDVKAVIALLGNPSKRFPGLPNVRGNALQQFTEMGIETLLYKSLGVEVYARRKRIYTVRVSGPFQGIFHGGRVGTHISEIIQKLGNPYVKTFTTKGVAPIKHIKGQVWNWKGEDTAIYKTHPNRDHFVVFGYDIYGKVTKIIEKDDDIRGHWSLY